MLNKDSRPRQEGAFLPLWRIGLRAEGVISTLTGLARSQPAEESVEPVLARSGCRSITGSYRKTNQDRCLADARRGIFLVADGVGGHRGGAEASQILVDTIPAALKKLATHPNPDRGVVRQAFRGAIEAARDQMVSLARQHRRFEHMSSTMALAVLVNNTMYISHIGDSRIYLFSSGKLTRLTSDHTMVQALVDAGTITEQQRRTHPLRNIVLNCVGVKPLEEPPEVACVAVKPGDRVLLATDGLTGAVDDDVLSEVLQTVRRPQRAADALVDAGVKHDSRDNITCVVVDLLAVHQESLKPADGSSVLELCPA